MQMRSYPRIGQVFLLLLLFCFFIDANTVSNAFMSPNQDELKLALKQGTTLLGCIKEQAAKSCKHLESLGQSCLNIAVSVYLPKLNHSSGF